MEKQIKKFIIVGFFNAVIEMTTFYLLYKTLELTYSIASAVSFSLVIIISYLLNKYWTFNQKNNSKSEFCIYVFFYMIYLNFKLVILNIQVKYLSISPVYANLDSMFLTSLLTFFSSKYLIFKK